MRRGGKRGKVFKTGRQPEMDGGVGGRGEVRVGICVRWIKGGSVMSGIMRPGHPSAPCRLEMRDLVSSTKPLGVSWLRKGRREGWWGRGAGGSVHPRIPLPSSLSCSSTPPPPPPLSVLTAGLFLCTASSLKQLLFAQTVHTLLKKQAASPR